MRDALKHPGHSAQRLGRGHLERDQDGGEALATRALLGAFWLEERFADA